jgi:cation transport ATPase
MAGGFFLPFVYITFYLFIRNAGIPSFYRGFLYGVTDVNFESLRWNIPDLFFIIAFLITGMHVVKDLFADIRKQNILNVRILVIEMVVLLHISVISLLFCNDYKTPASLMFSTPVSILFLQCPEKKSGLFIRSLEYLVLICTLTAVRAAHFA